MQLHSQPGHTRSFRALGLPRFFLLPFSLPPSLPPSLPRSLAHSFTASLTPFTDPPPRSLTHPFFRSFIHSLITHWFGPSQGSASRSAISRRCCPGSGTAPTRKLDSHVPGDDVTPFQDKLKTFGINGRVLGPTVGAWCEVSEDFDLILDLIAHALADEETSTIQVPHHQSVTTSRGFPRLRGAKRQAPTVYARHTLLRSLCPGRKVTGTGGRSSLAGGPVDFCREVGRVLLVTRSTFARRSVEFCWRPGRVLPVADRDFLSARSSVAGRSVEFCRCLVGFWSRPGRVLPAVGRVLQAACMYLFLMSSHLHSNRTTHRETACSLTSR